MPAHRTALLSLILVFFLAGCEVKAPPLSTEQLEAKERAAAEGQRAADLKYLNDQVAIYNACTLLVNVCPESITRKGRELVEQHNYSGGGDSGVFWTVVAFKIAALGAGLASILIVFFLGIFRLVQPSERAMKNAIKQVKTAESEAQKILSDAKSEAQNALAGITTTKEEMQGEIEALEARRGRLQTEIDALTTKATHAKEEVERLDKELQRINLAKKAAANFK